MGLGPFELLIILMMFGIPILLGLGGLIYLVFYLRRKRKEEKEQG